MLRLVGDADLRTAKRQFLGEITNSDQNRISSQQSGLSQGQKGRDFITTFNQNTNIAAANANGALLLDALAVPHASRTSVHHTLIHEEYLARQQLQSVNKKRDQPLHDSTFLSSINASAIPEASLLVGHRKSNQAPSSTVAAVDIPHQKVLRASPDPNAPLVNYAKDVLGGGGGGATTSTKSVAFADPTRFIKQDANNLIPSSHLTDGKADEKNTFNGYLETEIRAKVAAARAEVRALTDALIGSYGMALFADLFTSADLRQQKKLLRTGGANADEKSDEDEQVAGGLSSESVDKDEGDNDAQVNLRSAYEKNQLLRIEARRQQLLFEQKQHEAEVAARQNQIANPNVYLYSGRNAEKKPMGEIAGHPLKEDHLPHLPSIRNPHHTAAEAQFLLKQYRLAMDAKDEVSQSAKREAYAEEQLARLGKLSQISAAALATARERMSSEEYKIAKRRQSFTDEKNDAHQGNNNNSSLSDETVSETTNRNVDASGLVDDYTQTNEIKKLEDLDVGEEEYGRHNDDRPTSTAVATVQRVKPLVHEDVMTPPNNSPPSSSSPVSSIRQIQAQVLLSYIMQAAAHYDPNAESRLRAIGGGGNNNKRSSHHHEGENDEGEESDFYDDGEGYLYDDEDPIDPHEYNLLRFAKGHHRHLFDRRQLPSEDDDDNVGRRDRAKESRKKRSDELIRENVDDKDRFFKTIAAMRGEADPKKYKKLLKEYYRNRNQQTRPPPVRFAAADADVYPYPTTTSSSGHHTTGTINSSDVLVSRAALHRNQESTLIGPQLISAIISTSTAPSESPSPKLQRPNHSSSKVTKTLRIEKNNNNASTFDESTLDPTIANRNNKGARQKITNKIVMEKKSASFSSSSPLMKRQEGLEGPNKKYPSSDTSKNSGGSNSILKKSTSYQNAIEVEKVVEEDEHDRRNAIIVKEGKRSNAGGSKQRGGNTMWAGGNASDAGTSITSNKGGLLPSGKAMMGRMMGGGGGSHSDTHTLGSNTSSPIRSYNNDRGKQYHDSNVSTATMDESTTRKGRNQNRGGRRRETSDGGSPRSRSSSSSSSSSTSSYSRRNNRRRNDSSLTSATEIADSSSYRPHRGGTVRGKNNKNLRSDSSSSHSSDAVMNGTAAGLKAVEGPRRAKNNGFFDASQNNNTTTNSGDANKEPKKKKGFWKRVISGIFGNKKNKGKKDDGNHTKAENKTGMTRPEEDDDEGSANLSGTDDEDGRPSRGRARSPTSSSSSATSKNSVLRGPTLKKNKNDDHSTDDANAARSFANTNTDASQSPRNNRREGDEDSSRSTSVSSTKQPAAPPVKKKSSLAVFSKFDCMGGKGGTVD